MPFRVKIVVAFGKQSEPAHRHAAVVIERIEKVPAAVNILPQTGHASVLAEVIPLPVDGLPTGDHSTLLVEIVGAVRKKPQPADGHRSVVLKRVEEVPRAFMIQPAGVGRTVLLKQISPAIKGLPAGKRRHIAEVKIPFTIDAVPARRRLRYRRRFRILLQDKGLRCGWLEVRFVRGRLQRFRRRRRFGHSRSLRLLRRGHCGRYPKSRRCLSCGRHCGQPHRCRRDRRDSEERAGHDRRHRCFGQSAVHSPPAAALAVPPFPLRKGVFEIVPNALVRLRRKLDPVPCHTDRLIHHILPSSQLRRCSRALPSLVVTAVTDNPRMPAVSFTE